MKRRYCGSVNNNRKCAVCKKNEHRCNNNSYRDGECDTDVVRIRSHHIIPRAVGGTDCKNNLVDLCAKCHALVHSTYNRMSAIVAVKSNPDFFKECLEIFAGHMEKQNGLD